MVYLTWPLEYLSPFCVYVLNDCSRVMWQFMKYLAINSKSYIFTPKHVIYQSIQIPFSVKQTSKKPSNKIHFSFENTN